MPDQAEEKSLILKATQLLTLNLVYIFVSGWTALDYYYRYFGIDPKTLGLSFHEVLVPGFTILFPNGKWLWPLYIMLLILPLLLEEILKNHRLVLSVILLAVLVAVLVGVYFVSQDVAQQLAQRDKSEKSLLPSITFKVRATSGEEHSSAEKGAATTAKAGDSKAKEARKKGICESGCYGRLLILRDDKYFIHGVTPIGQPLQGDLELSIYRAEDLTEVVVTEHK